ncbi:MAG: hypothetical protein M3548_00960 [Actinomycetota bacterium]|nr:hypothetical protein [Actinomycetota bacterium]
MSFQTSALILTWVALLLLALVTAGLVRQVHALSSTPSRPAARIGPLPGHPAPGVDRIAPALPAVLLFLSPNCHTCAEALAETTRLTEIDSGATWSVHGLYSGDAPEIVAPATAHAHQSGLFAAYDVIATPFAVLVGTDGRVTTAGPVGSRKAVRELLGTPSEPRPVDTA